MRVVDKYVRVGGVVYPTVIDDSGVQRFIENPVVRFLVNHGSIDLNAIARAYQQGKLGPQGPKLRRAYVEFNMMLGYFVGGLMDLFHDMDVENLSDTEVLALAGTHHMDEE